MNTRSAALYVLAVIGIVFVLEHAKEVLLPAVLSIFIGFSLNPIVSRMRRWKIPRSVSAGILLTAVVGLFGFSIYALGDQLTEMVNRMPEAAQKLRKVMKEEFLGKGGPMQKVQEAAREIDKAAKEASGSTMPPRATPPSAGETFSLQSYLWLGSIGALGFVTQAVVIFFLSYFLLISGDLLKRKLVKIIGQEISNKKITVQILGEIAVQISKFLQVQLFISVLVGIVSWLILAGMKMEHAATWGLANAFATWIPYFGPTVITVVIVVTSFLQFDSIGIALLVGAALTAMRTIEGMLLIPWLTGRVAHMNSVAVFVSLLFWGWIWGAWGLLLGVPITMACKVICDHVEDLKPIGELLGE